MTEPKVHPVAALFPMMPEDELKTLADDITQRGLLNPIIIDTQDRILDGRNRHAACEIAGIQPTFTIYAGNDPAGYALAANINRRHMTKGQGAMVVAKALLLNNNQIQQSVANQHGVSQAYIAKAMTIIEYASDQVERVIIGLQSLNDAYDIARNNKKAKEQEADQLAALPLKPPTSPTTSSKSASPSTPRPKPPPTQGETMPNRRNERALSGAAATREQAKQHREHLEANPIDWAERWAGIRNFMDDLDARYPR